MSAVYLSLCFPALNEAPNIKGLIEDALGVGQRMGKPFEVIVVDDGSTDHTAALLQRFVAADARVRAVHHPANRGYGAAVWSGLRAARGRYLFYSDADRQFDLGEIKKLFEHIPRHDAVVGYRFKRQDHLIRRLNTWGWALLTHAALGLPFKDPDCAFKLFRRGALDGITVNAQGAVFSPELLYRLLRAGRRIKEIPVTHLPRRAGNPTGASVRVIARALRELGRLWAEERRRDGRKT